MWGFWPRDYDGGMTKTLHLMVAAVALVLPNGLSPQGATSSSEQDPIPFGVMTFNIRTAAGRDGDNVWPNRKELVAETIRRYSPQVIGLQEALDEQIEFLSSELPGYRWLGIDRGLNGGTGLSEYTPIFYKHGELSPVESGNFWLSDTPETPRRGRRGSRIVTWARFHHLETGRQIYVFNTHFTLRRGERQHRSAEQIRKRVAELPPGSTVIVTGDFNSLAEVSQTWRIATEERLRDAWVLADERQGPALTANGFGPPPEGREGRIDWILVGGPVAVLSMETVVREERGRYPSDHYPVVARLELKE